MIRPAIILVDMLKRLCHGQTVEKCTYSGFYETGLDGLLRSLYKDEGARTLILGGLHTHICIRHTTADAFFRGYHIVIASDGVEAFTAQDHEQGLKYLETVYSAKILTTNQIIEDLVATAHKQPQV